MTLSIVARSADGESWGVAVASKFLAVGAAVPAAEAGVGAIATQSYANLSYRPEGLRMLAAGRTAQATLDALTSADPGRESRQAGAVDRDGGAATFTGSRCHPWAGGVTGDGYAIQGNILSGEDVVSAADAAWRSGDPAQPLARRLLATLVAAEAAGGDRRGRQSAALLVVSPGAGYGGSGDVVVDLRVDDHPRPIAELGRLLDIHELHFGRADPGTLLALEDELAEEVGAMLARLGYSGPDVGTALATWADIENFEERMLPGRIDPLVLDQLRAQATAAPPPAADPPTTDPPAPDPPVAHPPAADPRTTDPPAADPPVADQARQ